MGRRRAWRATLAALALVGRALAADGWETVERRDGVTVEARDRPGSSLHELRATAHAAVAPAVIADVLWRPQDFPQYLPYLSHLEILHDGGDERVLYEQFAVPLLKDRDVVLRVRRHVDEATGVIELESHAVHDTGPPENPRFVRVRESETHWHLVPAAGGTDAAYVVRADLGGMVPSWIVNTAQRKTVPAFVHAILDRAASGPRP